jgi:hypothetical protein
MISVYFLARQGEFCSDNGTNYREKFNAAVAKNKRKQVLDNFKYKPIQFMEYSTVEITQAFKNLSNQYREELSMLDTEFLNKKPNENGWCIGVIINHIVTTNNIYDEVFNQVIEGKYKAGFITKIPFLPKWIGKMIVDAVKPDSKKIKTQAAFQPTKTILDKTIFDDLARSNDKLIQYFQTLSSKNSLNKVITSPASDKICYTISDAFIIMLEHEKKHLQQAIEVKNII